MNAIAPGEVETSILSPGTEKIVERLPCGVSASPRRSPPRSSSSARRQQLHLGHGDRDQRRPARLRRAGLFERRDDAAQVVDALALLGRGQDEFGKGRGMPPRSPAHLVEDRRVRRPSPCRPSSERSGTSPPPCRAAHDLLIHGFDAVARVHSTKARRSVDRPERYALRSLCHPPRPSSAHWRSRSPAGPRGNGCRRA